MSAATYINNFTICDCPIPNCGCSGGTHAYLPYYRKFFEVALPDIHSVFEWGPGDNTRIALEYDARVISVEQDRRWIPNIIDRNWVCIYAQVDSPWYVSLWGNNNADLYFIDSRRRAECINMVFTQCQNDRAVIAVHDAQRKRYQDALQRFPYVVFLDRGFALASKNSAVLRIAEQIKQEMNHAPI